MWSSAPTPATIIFSSSRPPITPAVAPGTLAGTAQWSRDSKSILLPYYKYKGKQSAGFSIYDVATHKTGSLVTRPSVDRNVIWGRSSNEIAGSDDALDASPANTVRFYSLDREVAAQVGVNGWVEHTIRLPFGSTEMPGTGNLIDITMAGTAGYPGAGGIRF